MKPILRILVVCVVVLGIAGGLIWGFLSGRSEQAAEAQRNAPVEAPSRVAAEGGKTVLTFDEQAQRANGIAVTTLAADRRSAETQATGVILQLQPLLDLKTSYNGALMDTAKARAAANASQAEYGRLSQLNQGGQNVSEKSVEAARAASESDSAVLQNAEQSLAVLKSSIPLHWGAVVAGWLEQGSPQLDALLAQREYLLQVTATSDAGFTAPVQATVQFPDGSHAISHLISVLPQLDPRLQAPSFLYSAAAHPGLVPGINLPVFLTSGPARRGVIVPYSAVVWWQGRAWCYVEEPPGKFAREEVSTVNPTPNGWFVSDGIAAGARVVTAGAQTLLSEEFRSQIQADQD
jgi:hypothetical protein